MRTYYSWFLTLQAGLYSFCKTPRIEVIERPVSALGEADSGGSRLLTHFYSQQNLFPWSLRSDTGQMIQVSDEWWDNRFGEPFQDSIVFVLASL